MQWKLSLILLFILLGCLNRLLGFSDPLDGWILRGSGLTNNLRGVAFGNSRFVAVGEGGAVATSTNGVSWVSQYAGSNSLSAIAFGQGTFIAVGENGTILTSSDGFSWTKRDAGFLVSLGGVGAASGLFVAVGGSTALVSADAINWTREDLGPDAYANAISYGNNLFVVVGGASPGFHQLVSSISVSSDGFTWTRQATGGLESLASISYGAGRFVAVGATGDPHCCDHALIRVSGDGMTWSESYLPMEPLWGLPYNPDLRGVSFADETFVVVGDCGRIATSPDGAAWYNRNSPARICVSLSAVASGLGSFVAVGSGGAILQSAHLGGVSVTTTNDHGPGSLREAIAEAAPAETIKLEVTGRITLTGGELYIDKDLAIIGPSRDSLAVSGNHTGRVFNVDGFDVRISGLTICDGCVDPSTQPQVEPWGGGILNSGTLVLTDCGIVSNSVTGGQGFPGTKFFPSGQGEAAAGGGIYNFGQLTLIRCEIGENSATGGFGGSAYYGGGGQGGLGFGGGIGNEGTIELRQCTLFGNSAHGGGGGLDSARRGPGGDGQGGGIANACQITLNQCTLSRNCARGGEGGGPLGNGGGSGQGGAIAVSGDLMMNLCTVSGNGASPGFGGPKGEGGGVFLSEFAQANLTHSTIAMNTALNGGGLRNGGSATLRNCIVAANESLGDCDGSVTSQGYNLIQRTNGCSILGMISNNIYGQDPLLGPLQDNGGPTWTHALLPGSLAIDNGDSGGQPTDQRGGVRPVWLFINSEQGDGSDIGAFEVGGYIRITSLARTNDDIRVEYTTDAGMIYSLERADFGSSVWTAIIDSFPGTGALATFTEKNAALKAGGLYRVILRD